MFNPPFEDIECYARAIVEEFNPEQIILFGSRAWGIVHEWSDVDLLVVMPFEDKGMRQAVRIVHALTPPFALDLIVRSPEQFENCVLERDFFLQKCKNEGIILYERKPD